MSDTTDAIMAGELCAECLTPFRRAHGYPVLCQHCFTRAPKDTPYRCAIHKEAT